MRAFARLETQPRGRCCVVAVYAWLLQRPGRHGRKVSCFSYSQFSDRLSDGLVVIPETWGRCEVQGGGSRPPVAQAEGPPRANGYQARNSTETEASCQTTKDPLNGVGLA